MREVRDALYRKLESRGFDVASDTVASRGELYVRGDGDSAAAMFEFKQDAHEAFQTMYQGRWTEGLPPRFAVLPIKAATEPDFELLDQVGITPLLYQIEGEDVTFLDLDAALEIFQR